MASLLRHSVVLLGWFCASMTITLYLEVVREFRKHVFDGNLSFIHMHFGLIVLLYFHFTSTMSSEEDDFSLSGLTQQDPEYQELPAESSDEGGIDHLQLLFESARKLAGGKV